MQLNKQMTGATAVLLLLVLLPVGTSARQVRLGFEDGFKDWTPQGSGWSVYGRRSSEGDASARCLIEKKTPAGIQLCAHSITKVNPGALVTLHADVAGRPKSGSSRATMGLICLDAAGGVVREFTHRLEPIDTDFKTFKLEENMIPSGTKEVVLVLAVEVLREAEADEWWCFDRLIIDIE